MDNPKSSFPEIERNLISSVPEGVSVNAAFNGKQFGKYDMRVMMDADGVSCSICGEEAEENIYYCEQDNIFMHKQCLIKKHRICENASIIEMQNRNESTFHEDRSVDVRFKEASNGGVK